MSVSVCIGKYATTPYVFTGLDMKVFCVEELCYVFRENTFLLDESILTDTLVDWLANECGLKELAKELYPLVHKQGTLSIFVMLIVEYVGFYDKKVMDMMEQVLKHGVNMSNMEKRKSQIDYLVYKKKYVAALRNYGRLLTAMGREAENDSEQAATRATILHNTGVAFAHMMLYKEAARCFLSAYELDSQPDYFTTYLAAKRMELTEKEYLDFVADYPDKMKESLAVEKRLEQAKAGFEGQMNYQLLQQRKKWRVEDKQRYYDDNEQITIALEDGYRMQIME